MTVHDVFEEELDLHLTQDDPDTVLLPLSNVQKKKQEKNKKNKVHNLVRVHNKATTAEMGREAHEGQEKEIKKTTHPK